MNEILAFAREKLRRIPSGRQPKDGELPDMDTQYLHSNVLCFNFQNLESTQAQQIKCRRPHPKRMHERTNVDYLVSALFSKAVVLATGGIVGILVFHRSTPQECTAY